MVSVIMAAVGHGGLKEGQIINKMVEFYERDHKKVISDAEILASVEDNAQNKHMQPRKSKSGIIVKGIDDIAVRFSKCCSPVPGDEIVGFVTRGRGVSIHRTDCINVLNLPEFDRARLIGSNRGKRKVRNIWQRLLFMQITVTVCWSILRKH